jgi:hypothetical protein
MSTRAIVLLLVVALAAGLCGALLPRVWGAVVLTMFSMGLVLWHLYTYKPEGPVSR